MTAHLAAANFNKRAHKSAKSGPNKLFEKWIEELRADAIARDLQSKHTYTKCLNSLKKYPLPLYNGRECSILEGFGDKICQLIDKKLEKFISEGGKLHDNDDNVEFSDTAPVVSVRRNEETVISDDDSNEPPVKSIFKQRTKTTKPANTPLTTTLAENTFENDVNNANTKSPAKGKRKASSKEYMPEYRSGAYAILVALFNHEIEEDNEEAKSMLKAQLISEAQKHSDSSFSTSESSNPNSHYTAWSSMTNLIKKSLVEKSNTLPARYALTESGRDLAFKLTTNHTNKENQIQNSQQQRPIAISKPELRHIVTHETYKVPSSPIADEIKIIDDDYNQPTNFKKLKTSEYENIDDAIVVLDESSSSSSSDDSLPDINIGVSSSQKYAKSSQSQGSFRPFASQTFKTTSKQPIKKPSEEPSFSSNKKPETTSNKFEPCQMVSVKPTYHTTNDTGTKPKSSDIVVSFDANSYEIILIVDTCETSHAKRQEIFLKELNKTGVKYEVSKLNIGDFTWIARSKISNSFQQTDIVLDYVVERKRVDDLCQSIIDGRYKEQKFRLKRSGISNIIYMIEQFGSMKNFNLPESSIRQAIINTQIIDGFFVKQTNDIKDSVNYLVEFTNYLIRAHNGLKLNACLKEKLDEYYGKTWPRHHNQNHEKPHTFLLTFQEFNENSNKNKPPTIKEMFGRCLIQINGLSEEKCMSILDKYPTPKLLFQAYANCRDDNERVKMLSNLKYGKQNRNLGPVLSRLIATLFYTQGPLN